MLWAAQGRTDAREGLRAAPSAGALYPLMVYAATSGELWRYIVQAHAIERVFSRNLRADLAAAALGQRGVGGARVAELLDLGRGGVPLYLVSAGTPLVSARAVTWGVRVDVMLRP